MQINRSNLLAVVWGLAEATVFFLIPDVLLSWIAIQNRRRALVACTWVTAGALSGGAILWLVGRNNPEAARQIFTFLPAITADMIIGVNDQLERNGLIALFIGPFVGTPYKIYAVEAASLGYGLGIFLLISLPARLLRFAIVSLVAGTICQMLSPKVSLRNLRIIHLVFWLGLYGVYFSVMPSKG